MTTTLDHPDWVEALALLPDGLLATACNDQLVRVWDPEVRPAGVPLRGSAGRVWNARLTDYGAGDLRERRALSVWTWLATTSTQSGNVVQSFQGHFDNITDLVVWGSTIISSSIDATVRFWPVGKAAADEIAQTPAAPSAAAQLSAEEEAELAALMAD